MASRALAPGAARNWSENVVFRHARFAAPEDIFELRRLVADAPSSERLRCLGSSHSFSEAAAAPQGGTCVSLAMMREILEVDVDAMTVRAQGGVTYGDLCRYLAPRGLALRNVPSLPHVSVVGAMATATHGSGLAYGNLLSHVAEVQYVKADGELATYHRGGGEDFSAALVGLGALGPVSEICVDVVETFDVSQGVYGGIPIPSLIDRLQSTVAGTDSFSAMINFGTGECDLLFLRQLHLTTDPYLSSNDASSNDASSSSSSSSSLPPRARWGGADGTLLTEPEPFFEAPDFPVKTTHTGPWHDTLSFFMDGCKDLNMPNLALQAEFMVPLDRGEEALQICWDVAGKWPGWPGTATAGTYEAPGLVIHNETRVVPGDNFALSPYFGRDTLAIHFTLGPYPEDAARLVAELQAALEHLQARPHWGKLSAMLAADVAAAFPNEALDAHYDLRRRHDPDGKFGSDWLDSILPAP
eukprot:g3755.t1